MNKNIKINKWLLSVLMTAGVATSCNDFLDINKDPNNPLDSRLSQVLPVVQTVIFEALGNGSAGMSDITSQFVHQTVQRGPSNFYFFAGNEFSISNAWPNLYAGALKDIDVIIEKAVTRQSYQYLGVAQILKAYAYSEMVDMWGKAAYSEFGQGAKNPFAKLDDGRDIYANVLQLLSDAKENLQKTSVETIGADDLIYGSDSKTQVQKWIKFGNSLKLKLYNNVRLTDLYDAADVASLIAENNFISSVKEGFKLKYGKTNNPENRHPLFNQDYVQNSANYIDPYFYLIMTGNGSFNPIFAGIPDPRVRYYFYNQLAGDAAQNKTTTAKFGDFLSIWFASDNIDPNAGFDQAQSQTIVGLYPAGGAYDDGSGVTAGVAAKQNPGLGGAGFQRLYPYFAHLYTRAELSLTKGAPGTHRTLFEDALKASFDEVNEIAALAGVPQVNGSAYITAIMAKYDAGTPAQKLELIMTEKWIASFGFSVDAYTDYRRTGYPLMFDPNTDNNPFTILNRAYPLSLPYFVDDLQINPNADGQRNPATDKIFWDVD